MRSGRTATRTCERRVELSGANVGGANLIGANLFSANLIVASLMGSNLRDAAVITTLAMPHPALTLASRGH